MTAALGGLAGGGGPLGAASGLTGGLAGGDGGPLGAASGLTSGLSGDGGPLGAATGLAGGLLGGGEGLNVIGLVGIGSDDDALLDLSPAEKKKVKAQKAAIAAQNEKKRQEAMKRLQQQVQAQGGQATPEQRRQAQQIQESQAADQREMAKLDQQLGPTDPELFQSAMAGGDVASASNGFSQGLMYAYLVDSSTHTPTHTLTFANAAAAEQWYAQASARGSVEKFGPQMYFYSGVPPAPVGKMACMPIQTVQPIIPLQRSDGYPICCKPGSSSNAAASASPSSIPQRPAAPPRKKLTFDDAAQAQVAAAKARGDSRPDNEIHAEAVRDLEDACCGRKPASAGGQAAAGPYSSGSSGSYPGTANDLSQPAAGGLASGASDTAAGGAGGDLLGGLGGGLLGSGQGLNVAGLLAVGSDEKALLDLNPAQKKEEKLKQKRELEKQQKLQQQQMQALQEQVKKQNGNATPKQKQTYQELLQRDQAAKQANQRLDESMARDEAAEKQAGGLGGAIPGGLPTDGLTGGGLPTDGLTGGGLPGANALGALPTGALPTNSLPTSGLTGGLGL